VDPITGAVEKKYTSFAEREPAVLAHLLSAPVLAGVTYLVQQGIVGNANASDLQSGVVSAIVFVVILAQGFVLRRFVSPWWKVHTGHDLPATPLDGPLTTVTLSATSPPQPPIAPLSGAAGSTTSVPTYTPQHAAEAVITDIPSTDGGPTA
jgi:hypothetical protein